MASTAPQFKCLHCGRRSTREEWNMSTKDYFGDDPKLIEDGFGSAYYDYTCPSCGKVCYKEDIEDHWPDIGINFYGINE